MEHPVADATLRRRGRASSETDTRPHEPPPTEQRVRGIQETRRAAEPELIGHLAFHGSILLGSSSLQQIRGGSIA